MQRPLLAVCICLVAVITAGMFIRGASPGGSTALTEGSVTVTGNVYRKDSKYFYLDSVLIQNHAVNQQQIPLEEKLMCENLISEGLLCGKEAGGPKIGSKVTLQGIFREFNYATNPGEFDAADYYRTLGIAGRIEECTIWDCSENYSLWRETLFELQNYFRQRLYRIFPEKEASVMTAMLLGDKQELNDEVKMLYQENGIIHILSISGLHITIIGMSIYKFLRRVGVPVWLSALLGGIILLLYGVMTGMSISACRAIGMYMIKLFAEVVGRTYDMLIAMGVMAAGMVAVNPLYVKNAGFLLSYGAIVGIGIVYPVLSEQESTAFKVRKYQTKRWKRIVGELWGKFIERLKQSMLSGLSVTLTTLPILLWFYYEIPVYSVVLNLFVLPFMTVVMLSGMVAMLVPGLGVLGTVDCIVLGWYEWLCRLFERLPFSVWNPGRPQVWQIMMYYGVLLLVVIEKDKHIIGKVRNRIRRKKNSGKEKEGNFLRILILTVSVGVFTLDLYPKTTVTFLDVGQGDCICVQLASGEVYLFDCGSTGRSAVGTYVLKPYLKYSGISHIDGVFVSHADRDHCNGVEELLENGEEWGITVGLLVVSGEEGWLWAEELCGGGPGQISKAVAAQEDVQIPNLTTIQAGDSWEREDSHFLCLHPASDFASEDSNAASQCFYIELGQGLTLLLAGDVEAEGEARLLAELQKRGIEGIDVLKVAHHGSKYASDEAVLAQIRPQLAVISCGRDNCYGHPHSETLERLKAVGSKILTTAEAGAITIESGKVITIKQTRSPHGDQGKVLE